MGPASPLVRRGSAVAGVAVAGVLPVASSTATTRAAAAGDQDAADEAIEAFIQTVVDAGFVTDGDAADEADLFDVVPPDGDDPADFMCSEAIRADVADDGSLVAETAGAVSDSFSYEPSGDESAGNADSISATVVAVGDDGLFRLTSGFTSGGEPVGLSSTSALARAGNHLALVTLFTTSGEEAGYDPVDALGALVESLAP